MTSVDDYLGKVRRHLIGMRKEVREDILRELMSHISDWTKDQGRTDVLKTLEPPKVVAARYKEIYGYGNLFKTLFAAGAGLLAIPTLPVLPGVSASPVSLLSLLFLVGTVSYLIVVSVKAGKLVGLLSGTVAAISRIGALVWLSASQALFPRPGDFVGFILLSTVLAVIGYIPGRTKEKWKRPEPSM